MNAFEPLSDEELLMLIIDGTLELTSNESPRLEQDFKDAVKSALEKLVLLDETIFELEGDIEALRQENKEYKKTFKKIGKLVSS
ncbi:hypothetical protein MFLO_14772 [Listeria floridensis FSL S10-1187]|uniref:Uncharacterized protein n=1 Tax=Listeria floridensis FSL S10-1187 TaxID=1265817 RepID=A0ABN0RBW8_9LIST|nr:hypothetical protein [Listeria floridensis]EUJ25791.1 hypothetical protein MFLO_14772 [Listeria floridensis FSL S10-1187]